MNILVAGYVGVVSIFVKELVNLTVWEIIPDPDVAVLMTGAHWLTIAVLSLIGLVFNPLILSIVLIHQLLYKSMFLLFYVLPNIISG